MSGSNATIFVRTRREGQHRWPQAPEHREYLRSAHRHLFHIEVSTWVTHDDREIEFHDLLDQVNAYWTELPMKDGLPMSCEMMARMLGELLVAKYKRSFQVSVSEDGECGASVFSGHSL